MSHLRTLLPALLLAVAAAAGVSVPPTEATEHVRGRPNILVVVTDDQRARGTMGVMPVTRRWFEGGARFPNAFATTPVCCPSRASIMTGRYAHNHGIRRNSDARDGFDHTSSVQRYLQDAGYRTGIAGKLFNQWNLSHDPPYFDRWAVMQPGYYGTRFAVDGVVRRVRRYSTDYIAAWARDFVRAGEGEDGRPWYLYVAPFAPHLPATPHWRDKHAPVPPWRTNPAIEERARGDKPPYVRERRVALADVRRDRALQLRSLMAVDDLMDALIEELQRTDEAGNTLVIFTSDNGYLWGEHGWDTKRLPYDASVRIPLMLRWPAGGLSVGVDRRLATNVDITPTILDAANVGTVFQLDGRSLLGTDSRGRLLLEIWGDEHVPTWASLLTRRYQYVEYYASDEDETPDYREYYDLRQDPWQLENRLGDDDPDNDPSSIELAQLSTELRLARRCRGTTFPFGCP